VFGNVPRGDWLDRVVTMGNPDTTRRLRWHAGLIDLPDSEAPTVAGCTWPTGERSPKLGGAVADFIGALQALNHELNGIVPSNSMSGADTVSRGAAYAVAEVIRMLEENGEAQHERWMVETAWLAVLAGDIDDLDEHIAQLEATL
jgi:hypothetical protein